VLHHVLGLDRTKTRDVHHNSTMCNTGTTSRGSVAPPGPVAFLDARNARAGTRKSDHDLQ